MIYVIETSYYAPIINSNYTHKLSLITNNNFLTFFHCVPKTVPGIIRPYKYLLYLRSKKVID